MPLAADAPPPPVAIIGSGGIGGFIAGALTAVGHRVDLCVRTPFDRLVIEKGGEERTVDGVRIVSDPEGVAPVRWILLTTKAQDTEGARGWIEALATPDTTLVVVQNGIEQAERGAAVAGSARVLPAIIYCSTERIAPGRIRHHEAARIVVPPGNDGEDLAALFAGTEFRVDRPDDFTRYAWVKLLMNLVANPITALTLRRMEVFREGAIRDLMRSVLSEAVATARAAGVDLTEADADKLVANQGQAMGGTSMFYDRLAGRPLEHDALTGALLRVADRHGVPVPINRTLYALLSATSGRAPADAG